jgi:hypothetical protein
LRYLFWMTFCAFVSYLLANKSNSTVTPLGTLGVVAYGATLGLAISIATRPRVDVSLFLKLSMNGCWILLATGFYFLVFRSVSYGPTRTVLTRGLLISLMPPVVWVCSGLVKAKRPTN